MGKILWVHILTATLLGSAVLLAEDDSDAPPSLEIVISVAEQKMALVKEGGLLRKYPISTSKFGLGDANGSYRTPLGRLRVCEKIGGNLAIGAVMKCRNPTGEILPANAPGRDPIVTRILWLEGLEAGNANAKSRGIYIHGTVEENKLGQPVSYGCIRMRSRDVVEVFDDTPIGTPVKIIADRFPHFQKVASPKPEVLLVSNGSPGKERISTVIDAHGMVKTIRTSEAPVAKAPPAAVPAKAAPQIAAAKAPEPSAAKVLAKAELPPEPKMDFGAHANRKLTAQTHASSRAKAAPAPQPDVPRLMFSDPTQVSARLSEIADPVNTTPSVEPAAGPHLLVLRVDAPGLRIDDSGELFHDAPMDAFSEHLFNPPPESMRLAFRVSAHPAEGSGL
jgi:lipoprotein-anchoring transpeptidase ErfK/SrfK